MHYVAFDLEQRFVDIFKDGKLSDFQKLESKDNISEGTFCKYTQNISDNSFEDANLVETGVKQVSDDTKIENEVIVSNVDEDEVKESLLDEGADPLLISKNLAEI